MAAAAAAAVPAKRPTQSTGFRLTGVESGPGEIWRRAHPAEEEERAAACAAFKSRTDGEGVEVTRGGRRAEKRGGEGGERGGGTHPSKQKERAAASHHYRNGQVSQPVRLPVARRAPQHDGDHLGALGHGLDGEGEVAQRVVLRPREGGGREGRLSHTGPEAQADTYSSRKC